MLKLINMNIYAALADVVVVIHFLYAATIIVGLILIYIGKYIKWHFVKNATFRIIHLVMIMIVAFESVFHIECPLTYIEYKLLSLAKMHYQNTPFIAGFINKILFWNLPNEFFDILYIALAIFILLSFFIVPIDFKK
ncbi:MAG: DUF2784 domain-containing protein [Desulfurella sp.]|uniref:DUF2784 domain-containing protein n=1 Tax=Desulfurella sp. TaxID=1962857 RepID=UPI003D0FE8FC